MSSSREAWASGVEENRKGDYPPLAECISCGHIHPLTVWKAGTDHGICAACRDAAWLVRGSCSKERGCRCVQAR